MSFFSLFMLNLRQIVMKVHFTSVLTVKHTIFLANIQTQLTIVDKSASNENYSNWSRIALLTPSRIYGHLLVRKVLHHNQHILTLKMQLEKFDLKSGSEQLLTCWKIQIQSPMWKIPTRGTNFIELEINNVNSTYEIILIDQYRPSLKALI